MTTPARIDPDALYDDVAVRMTIPIGAGTLAKARRDGSLKYKRAGVRTLYFGRWLIEWLESTDETSPRPDAEAARPPTLEFCGA